MTGRLNDKVAIVFGAGQTPGPNIGNGRACAILYAREGAKVACVDLDLEAADTTRRMIEAEGGQAVALQADVTRESDCQAAVPAMRARGTGCIINISSMAALCSGQPVAYSTTKLALHALTHQRAMSYAKDGVRVNAILPGLIDTPVAVEGVARRMNLEAEQVRAQRDARVPLRNKQGTAWDVAFAALFLASAEANFITGVVLPVDGGQTARIG